MHARAWNTPEHAESENKTVIVTFFCEIVVTFFTQTLKAEIFIRGFVRPSVCWSVRWSWWSSWKVWKCAFPPLPTRPQLVLAMYPALFTITWISRIRVICWWLFIFVFLPTMGVDILIYFAPLPALRVWFFDEFWLLPRDFKSFMNLSSFLCRDLWTDLD